MPVKPIRFDRESMVALLAGRKTMTRRLVKAGHTRGFTRYQVGDFLWVKERWSKVPSTAYRQSIDVDHCVSPDGIWWSVYEAGWDRSAPHWTSNLFMPKWACRMWLRVTEVRLESLQDISEADCIAEGCPDSYLLGQNWYRERWDGINKKPETRWADNPLVEVYRFEQVEKPEGWPL